MSMEWFDAVSISKIYNRLFVGGYVQAAKLSRSNPFGIQAVLDVSTEPPYEEARGVVYAHIPFNDGEGVPPEKFWACMRFLFEQYKQGHTILIHCAAGISRSVTITAAFLHYVHIMEFNAALDLVRQRRPIANPNVAVLSSVRKLLRVWPHDGSYE
jgi:dual specificity phosphatase 12